MDHFIERSNEDLMVLTDENFKRIIKSVTDKLGKSSQKNTTYNPVTNNAPAAPLQSTSGIPFQKSTVANLLENTKV
jgi:hypothetical protein